MSIPTCYPTYSLGSRLDNACTFIPVHTSIRSSIESKHRPVYNNLIKVAVDRFP